MMCSLGRYGLFVVFRAGDDRRDPIGFAIKPKGRMTYTERRGYWRGFCLGPLYFRTYRLRGVA